MFFDETPEQLREFHYQLAHDASVPGLGQVVHLDRLESEYSRLVETMNYFGDHDAVKELEMAVDLGVFWDISGRWLEAKERLAATIQRQSDQSTVLYLRGLIDWAAIPARQDDHTEALQILDQAEPLAAKLNDQYCQTQILRLRSGLAGESGDQSGATELGLKALELAKTLGDDRVIANCYRNLAWIDMGEGRYQEAKTLFENSLVHHEKIENQSGMAAALNSIGTMQFYLGDFEEAEQTQNEALNLAAGIGFKNVVACCYISLGRLHQVKGEARQADNGFRMALPIFHKIRNRVMVAYCLEQIGKLAFERSHLKRASVAYSLANRIRAELKSPWTPAEIEIHSEALTQSREAEPREWADAKSWDIDETIRDFTRTPGFI